MKVLIWIGCFFVNALITTILKESGIILGGIPTVILYGVTVVVAPFLCKKWDEHKGHKEPETNVSAQTPVIEIPVADTVHQARFCHNCGEKLLEGSRFCRKCGTEIVENQKGTDQK